MSQFYVVAQYESLDEANVGLQVLDKLGMEHDAISLVTRKQFASSSPSDDQESDGEESNAIESSAVDISQDQNIDSLVDRLKSPMSSQTAAGAGAGAALATGLALPLSITTAVAPFFVAGPLFAAVVGAIGGATVGAGQSDRTDSTNYYRELVESGATLVIFSGNRAMALEAERGLKTTRTKRVDLIEATE